MSAEDNEAPRPTQEQLLAELDCARQEFFEKLLSLDMIIGDVPSGLPAPDGAFRIKNSAKQRDVAYAKYKALLKRLQDQLGDSDS